MPADCYWCKVGKSYIPIAVGSTDNPIGCCENCYVFACGHHAQRDPKKQVFQCLDCDPKMLTASAQALVDAEGDTPGVETARVGRVTLIYDGDDGDYFTSFDDFRIRRPGYGEWLDKIKTLHENLYKGGNRFEFGQWQLQEAQRLLVAAAYILAKTAPDAPLEEWGYPAIIVQLKRRIDDDTNPRRDRYPAY
jgi:hypothetical protein